MRVLLCFVWLFASSAVVHAQDNGLQGSEEQRRVAQWQRVFDRMWPLFIDVCGKAMKRPLETMAVLKASAEIASTEKGKDYVATIDGRIETSNTLVEKRSGLTNSFQIVRYEEYVHAECIIFSTHVLVVPTDILDVLIAALESRDGRISGGRYDRENPSEVYSFLVEGFWKDMDAVVRVNTHFGMLGFFAQRILPSKG